MLYQLAVTLAGKKTIVIKKVYIKKVCIPRENRLCNFCNLSEAADEYRYCMVCPQNEFLRLRNTFIQSLNFINSKFQFLDKKSLLPYIILMADRSIITITSTYFFNSVLKLYNLLIEQRNYIVCSTCFSDLFRWLLNL